MATSGTMKVEFGTAALGMDIAKDQVKKVTAGGQADTKGVKIGWTISSVNGSRMSATSNIRDALEKARKSGKKFPVVFSKPAQATKNPEDSKVKDEVETETDKKDEAESTANVAEEQASGSRSPSRRSSADICTGGEMTAHNVRQLCARNQGYDSPELNDVLYLQCAGLTSIATGILDPYINVQSLFLQENNLNQIENLHMLPKLRSLYLNANRIDQVENVASFPCLMILNLARSRITHIPSSCLPISLEQLNVSYNAIQSIHDLQGVFECPKTQFRQY
eukprot:GEMP01035907.1.p1 GENE.GEMP01035907.1~~GEMP01035907.1.p1  ORF type:complete len:279 (+),score=28.01 GEMP01035907.1:49-885(+)